MAATSAHLVENVLPSSVPLRQWVLTFPHAWRSRLGYDAPLLSALSRLFVQTVLDMHIGIIAIAVGYLVGRAVRHELS